jgi:hypothetical protein
MNRFILLALFVGAVYYFGSSSTVDEAPVAQAQLGSASSPQVSRESSAAVSAPSSPASANYSSNDSGKQIQGSGSVIRLLSDDNDGSRHQRFIIRLPSGQTLLVAHNIDIAPRISDLAVGDNVQFNGEYEWNSQGGLVHWTHHDPGGRHVGGWLRRGGSVYE